MGHLTLSTRTAILILALAGLAACERTQPAASGAPASGEPAVTDIAAMAPEDGELVLCPGDPRCGRAGLEVPEPTEPTCHVRSPQHFTMMCRLRRGQPRMPCPGPGCPGGEVDDEADCRLDTWYAYVQCDDVTAAASGAAEDPAAGDGATAETPAE